MKPSTDSKVGEALADLARYQNEASRHHAKRLGLEPIYSPLIGFDDELVGTPVVAENLSRLTSEMEKIPLAVLYNPSVTRMSDRERKRIAYHEAFHNYTDGLGCIEVNLFGNRFPLGRDLEEGLAELMTEKNLGYLGKTSYKREYELAKRIDEEYGAENFIRDFRKKGISVLKDERIKKAVYETYLPLILTNSMS